MLRLSRVVEWGVGVGGAWPAGVRTEVQFRGSYRYGRQPIWVPQRRRRRHHCCSESKSFVNISPMAELYGITRSLRASKPCVGFPDASTAGPTTAPLCWRWTVLHRPGPLRRRRKEKCRPLEQVPILTEVSPGLAKGGHCLAFLPTRLECGRPGGGAQP